MNIISTQHSQTETDMNVVAAELERLLAERRFSGAPQMTAFLRYIVTETMNGNADRIKAYSVGVDALGKPVSFDAQADPSVRVLALRLRKTLAAVYENSDKHLAIIDLRVGTYVPEFYKAGGPFPDGTRANVLALPVQPESKCDTVTINRYSESANSAAAGAANKPEPQITVAAATAKEKTDPASDTSTVAPVSGKGHGLHKKLSLMGGALLIAATWQIAIHQSDANALAAVKQKPAELLSLAASVDADGQPEMVRANADATRTTPIVPTIHVRLSETSSEIEQRVTTMLSSGFVQSGTVNVIRQTANQETGMVHPGEYTLIVEGFKVGEEFRIDAQVVNLTDGELLYAASMVTEQAGAVLSSSDINVIESVASGIASIQGPLYKDFCNKNDIRERVICTVT